MGSMQQSMQLSRVKALSAYCNIVPQCIFVSLIWQGRCSFQIQQLSMRNWATVIASADQQLNKKKAAILCHTPMLCHEAKGKLVSAVIWHAMLTCRVDLIKRLTIAC